MEYIVLQPLQATVPDKNISLIQRKSKYFLLNIELEMLF